ncbi:penicillin-binding protein [Bizionia argentinensis JUB59]|uniref:Penicillin-binding protein n=1 Tax=Bizionia argentinensis JUB59 TaxID=1046627 RepID=G2EH73_9FLAO|nr:transglycosylase domain-containing protein [Bizionia argentinensis]EGV42118.2 penicillin-binding protein [Bizionia argentinensis JUB59]
MDKLRVFFKKTWVKWSLILIAVIISFFVFLYAGIYFGVFGSVPTHAELGALKQAEATQVLDKNEKLIGKYYIYDRQPLDYEDLPKHLIDALVATEDVRFYEHDGVDNVSLMRVFFKSILLRDKSAGGGSTITLQLAKNLYGRKNYAAFGMLINKFKESIVAKRIEDVYSKQEILTLYFNTVPFPDNTYGIESAAQKFFNKTARKLTVPEAATLVGTLKANNYYNPRLSISNSRKRRNVVLNQMVKYDYLDETKCETYKKDSLVLNYYSFNHDLGLAPYFRAQVKDQLQTILKAYKKPNGDTYDLYKDGLIVHTTLDAKMQTMAEEAMAEHLTKLQEAYEASHGKNAPWISNKKLIKKAMMALPEYKRLKKAGVPEAAIEDSLSVKRDMDVFTWKGDSTQLLSVKDSLQHYLKLLNTGMLSIDPKSGAIQSYIGGIDYRYFKYDHVSQSERQVGSTFKPFVYTAAIENGMKPCKYYSIDAVTYTNYKNWTPTNAGQDPNEKTDINYNLEMALSNSVNTIAVKVLNDVGISNVKKQAEKMGITKKLPNQPSLALGVAEISLKELIGAYASFVNNSYGVKPYMITKITDRNGQEIVSFEPEILEKQAYSDYTRQVLLEMMKATVDNGTASRLRSTYNLSNEIAGKTGTTQDNKDGWFVGITPRLVTITWVGNDNFGIGFKTTALGQGANSALPMFARFYQKLNSDSTFNEITKSHFEKPSADVLDDLDCKLEKEDGFFKKLFKSKKKSKKFKGD